MEGGISDVEMLVKKGDAVIDIDAPTDSKFSLRKKHHDITNTSKYSNSDGETNEDPVDILVQKLEALPGQPHVTRPVTIFRVPILHNSVKSALEPKMVSIGPYHHGKRALAPIENHKLWYLRDFLARKPTIGVEIYLAEMQSLEKEARQCYSDVIKMSSDEFASMLLLDGCFILEYFLKHVDNEADYVTDVGWSNFETDISLRIENQIPFSVIHKLGTLYYGTVDHNCTDKCPVRTLLCTTMGFDSKLFDPLQLSCNKINHLLHLHQLRMTPPRIHDHDRNNDSSNNKSLSLKTRSLSWLRSKLGMQPIETDVQYRVPSVTKLNEAGVTFKIKNNPRDIFDITFENGVLEIPYMGISADDQVLFTNLLLYEQARNYSKKSSSRPLIFTSYAQLMDLLMETGRDAVILLQSGILGNFEPNDGTRSLLNQLCDHTWINAPENYYSDIMNKLINYSNLHWNRYRAVLVRDYFSSPWAMLSLIAAIFLLLLTATQTGFSIYPFVHPN